MVSLKVAKVLTYISTFATLVRPVKKLNCLNETDKLNCLNKIGYVLYLKSYHEKNNKKFKIALVTSFILLLTSNITYITKTHLHYY